MILVDTSVWIELLAGRVSLPAEPGLEQFATCGPIVQEVLQGLRPSRESELFADGFLSIPKLSDPIPSGLFVQAAEIYREGRRRGYTIRSSVDCLIAVIAIVNKVPVWHRDRDFTFIARYSPLRAFELPGPRPTGRTPNK